MRTAYPIGRAPAGEKWRDSEVSYAVRVRVCEVFIDLCRRKCGLEPHRSARYIVSPTEKGGPTVQVIAHDWAGQQYAERVLKEVPLRWDAPAREVLGLPEPDDRTLRETVEPAKLAEFQDRAAANRKREAAHDRKTAAKATAKRTRKKAGDKPADFHTPRPGSRKPKTAKKAAKKATKKAGKRTSPKPTRVKGGSDA